MGISQQNELKVGMEVLHELIAQTQSLPIDIFVARYDSLYLRAQRIVVRFFGDSSDYLKWLQACNPNRDAGIRIILENDDAERSYLPYKFSDVLALALDEMKFSFIDAYEE